MTSQLPETTVPALQMREFIVWGGGVLLSWVAFNLTKSLYRSLQLDRYFQPPWLPMQPEAKPVNSSEVEPPPEQPVQTSSLLCTAVGLVSVVSVLLATAMTYAHLENSPLIWQYAQAGLQDLWVVTVSVLLGLALARWVAGSLLKIVEQESIRRVLDDLIPAATSQTPPQSAESANKPPERFSDTIIRVLGMLIYAILLLPMASMLAEHFGWTALQTTMTTFWEWLLFSGQYLAVFGVVYLIVAFIAVTLIKPEIRGRFMIGTFLLGMILWGAISSPMLALGVIILLAVLAWWGRLYVPDLLACVYLMSSSARQIPTTLGPAKVKRLDPLLSRIHLLEPPSEDLPQSYLIRNQKLVRAILNQKPLDLGKALEEATASESEPKLLP